VKVKGQLLADLNVALSLFFHGSYVSLNFVDGVLERDEFKGELVDFHDECPPHGWMCRQQFRTRETCGRLEFASDPARKLAELAWIYTERESPNAESAKGFIRLNNLTQTVIQNGALIAL
jgi:hypothetical protein